MTGALTGRSAVAFGAGPSKSPGGAAPLALVAEEPTLQRLQAAGDALVAADECIWSPALPAHRTRAAGHCIHPLTTSPDDVLRSDHIAYPNQRSCRLGSGAAKFEEPSIGNTH